MDMRLWQSKQKIHTAWLIAGTSVGIVTGTALVPVINQTLFGSIVWLLLGVGLFGFVLWRKNIYLVPFVILAGLIIGLWRGSILDAQLTVYKNLIGHSVSVKGVVTDDSDSSKNGETIVRLGNVIINNHAVAGKVWISMIGGKEIKRGDTAIASGILLEGFGGFSAVMYRAKLVGIERPQPGDVARQTRDWFADKVRLAIDEPQASLGLGYLLGQKRALPPELEQALVVTGLTHVVVASGYNLTILVRLARRLFVKVSKYLAMLSASIMILGFIAVTGASPSMSRAGLVAGLGLAAWYYGRQFHPLILLPFAAAITVVVDPSYAWNDLGWQLSFTAFAGVMILAPLLQRYFFGEKKPGIIRQIIGETISASILTLPILVLAFSQFSNVALIANLLVLPLVPLAMLLTFIAGIGVVMAPALANVIGLPADLLLSYMVNTIHFFAGLSWAQTTVAIQPWMVWFAYAVIVTTCIYLWRITKYDLKQLNIVE